MEQTSQPARKKLNADGTTAWSGRVDYLPTRSKSRGHKPFICLDCPKRFVSRPAGEMHWRDTHGRAANIDTPEGK